MSVPRQILAATRSGRYILTSLHPHILRFSITALLLAAWIVTSGCGATVRTTTDDATITARVKTALLNDPQIAANGIQVSTVGAVVTIAGSVKSKDDETRAVQIARGVTGVKDVRSTLRVQ